jgi:hypothetical protein
MNEIRFRAIGGNFPLLLEIAGTGKGIKSEIVVVGKCASAREAIEAAKHPVDEPVPVQINDGQIALYGIGLAISFTAVDDKQFSIVGITVPGDGHLIIGPRAREPGHSIAFWAHATANVPVNAGEFIAFSTALAGDHLLQIDQRKLFTGAGSERAPVVTNCATSTSAPADSQPTAVEDLLTSLGQVFMVMRIIDSPDTAVLHIPLFSRSAEVAPKFWFAPPLPSLSLTSWVDLDVEAGALSVGSAGIRSFVLIPWWWQGIYCTSTNTRTARSRSQV